MKVVHAPRLFKYILRGYGAITIYPWVFTKDKKPNAVLLNHERIHLDQQKRDGLIKFYVKYCYEYVKNRLKGLGHWDSYYCISYEEEAYRNQENFYYQVDKRK